MADEVLPNTGMELPDVGLDEDTWGDLLNANLRILDNAITLGRVTKTLGAVDVTLTAAEAAKGIIDLSGTLTANVSVIVPAATVRLYLVRNGTTGAFSVTVKTPAGSGITVAQGYNTLLYSDTTNVVQGATSVGGTFSGANATLSGTLGVTGATTLAATSVTTITASGTATLAGVTSTGINSSPIGATTPSTGAFTTLSSTGNTTLGDASADTVTVNGTAAFAAATSFAAGTAALPSIARTADLDTGLWFPAANTVACSTNGAEAFRITSAGNLLVGTATASDSRLKVTPTNTADRYGAYIAGTYAGGSGVAGSVYGAYIQGFSTNSSTTLYGIYADTPAAIGQMAYGGYFKSAGSASSTTYGSFSESTQTDTNGPAVSYGVYGKVSSAGTNSAGSHWAGYFENAGATGVAANGLGISTVAGAATVYGVRYQHAGVVTFQVLSSGNVQNTSNSYGAISDSKLKNIIGSAPSYWEKYKLLEWVKYIFKNDPENQVQMGLIAQQCREVFPGLVEETPDMVDVEKTREVQKIVPVTATETQEKTRTEIVLESGEYIQKTITETIDIQVQVYDEFDLKNEAGEVIGTHKVPRTQTVTETETYTEREPNGEVTLSIKYSIVGHIADVVLQEAMKRIEALELKC